MKRWVCPLLFAAVSIVSLCFSAAPESADVSAFSLENENPFDLRSMTSDLLSASVEKCPLTVEEKNELWAKARSALVRAANRMKDDEFDAAEKEIYSAEEIMGQCETPGGIMFTDIAWGMLRNKQGRFGEAKRHFEETLRYARVLNDRKTVLFVQRRMAMLYLKQGMLDKAEKHAREALAYSEEASYSGRGVKQTEPCADYVILGDILFYRKDYKNAEAYYDRVIKLCKKYWFQSELARAWVGKGDLCIIRGCLPDAREYFVKAFNLSDKIQFKGGSQVSRTKITLIDRAIGKPGSEGIRHLYVMDGMIFGIKSDWETMKNRLPRDIEQYKRAGDILMVIRTYSHFGIVLRMCGDLDEAEEMTRKAMEYRGSLDYRLNNPYVEDNLGVIQRMQGELDEAETSTLQSLAMNKELGHAISIAENHAELGKILHAKGDEKEAQKHWATASRMFRKMRMSSRQEEIDELRGKSGYR